ncbi:hypothetical protein I7I50_05877 [Histoplasma capsulatum G186AR]|uniref:Secreted protein n=1 Tax=Ajellomyces capsulatus TaxID=5037 RepID=A0A8H8D819_AJECA|nr:hypothetical protein I7I52_04136 [Histoplasma capsulatum]QSS76427.1 hypothetical protein I7I50_05877 [Histoplasma capsulatum G186AR]
MKLTLLFPQLIFATIIQYVSAKVSLLNLNDNIPQDISTPNSILDSRFIRCQDLPCTSSGYCFNSHCGPCVHWPDENIPFCTPDH